jgi:hypothetical protein
MIARRRFRDLKIGETFTLQGEPLRKVLPTIAANAEDDAITRPLPTDILIDAAQPEPSGAMVLAGILAAQPDFGEADGPHYDPTPRPVCRDELGRLRREAEKAIILAVRLAVIAAPKRLPSLLKSPTAAGGDATAGELTTLSGQALEYFYLSPDSVGDLLAHIAEANVDQLAPDPIGSMLGDVPGPAREFLSLLGGATAHSLAIAAGRVAFLATQFAMLRASAGASDLGGNGEQMFDMLDSVAWMNLKPRIDAEHARAVKLLRDGAPGPSLPAPAQLADVDSSSPGSPRLFSRFRSPEEWRRAFGYRNGGVAYSSSRWTGLRKRPELAPYIHPESTLRSVAIRLDCPLLTGIPGGYGDDRSF